MGITPARLASLSVPIVPAQGINPLRVARNGAPPSALHVAQLGQQINATAGRRLKPLASHLIGIDDFNTPTSATVMWRFMGHTSKNCQAIVCDLVSSNSDNVATTDQPQCYFTTAKVGGSSKQQDTLYLVGKNNDIQYFHHRQVWTDLDGSGAIRNTNFTVSLTADDRAKPVAVSIYEVPRDDWVALDLVADTEAGVSGPWQLGRVYDAQVTDYYRALRDIWKTQGSTMFSWSVPDGSPVTDTSTTANNIFDGSTSRTASTPGFPVRPLYRGSENSSDVPVIFWAYLGKSAGGGAGNLKFTGANGDIITLSQSAGTTGYVYSSSTTSGRLISTDTADKIDVLGSVASGGTLSTYAFGAYEYSA